MRPTVCLPAPRPATRRPDAAIPRAADASKGYHLDARTTTRNDRPAPFRFGLRGGYDVRVSSGRFALREVAFDAGGGSKGVAGLGRG